MFSQDATKHNPIWFSSYLSAIMAFMVEEFCPFSKTMLIRHDYTLAHISREYHLYVPVMRIFLDGVAQVF